MMVAEARWWVRARWLADPALAVLVFGLAIQPLLADHGCDCASESAWGYLLVAAQCAPIAVRRRWPFSALLVAGVATSVYGLTSLPDQPVYYAALVLMYNVAANGTRRASHGSAVIATFFLVVTFTVDWPDWDYQDLTVIVATFVTAYVLGDSVRSRRERTAALEARAAQLERTRFAESAAAVAAERNRIARELHDSVAHHVSLMVIQAEAGPVAVARRPEQAIDAFDAISATGKHAMAEMRQLLGVLKDDSASSRSPQPGLADLDELVERTRSAGLTIEVVASVPPGGLPKATDLSAYRVLQEALTNCVRHAPGSHVRVAVTSDEALQIEVVDDGPAADRAAHRPFDDHRGHGLISMRERLVLLGGELDVGPHDQGWRVVARLPLRAEDAP